MFEQFIPSQQPLLEAWDAIETSGIAASLAALSLSAAAFLANLVKNLAEKLKAETDQLEKLGTELKQARTKPEKAVIKQELKAKKKELKSVLSPLTNGRKAVFRLLSAFFFFFAALVESLLLDPLADKSTVTALAAQVLTVAQGTPVAGSYTYNQLLRADVGSFSALCGVGLVLLFRGAVSMLKASRHK